MARFMAHDMALGERYGFRPIPQADSTRRDRMQPMSEVTGSVLVVHGKAEVGQALRELLVGEGFGARSVATGEQALASLEERPFDVEKAKRVFLDANRRLQR